MPTSMSMLMLVAIMCYYLDIHDENPRKSYSKTEFLKCIYVCLIDILSGALSVCTCEIFYLFF